jgi:hypothetical protein
LRSVQKVRWSFPESERNYSARSQSSAAMFLEGEIFFILRLIMLSRNNQTLVLYIIKAIKEAETDVSGVYEI